MAGFGLKMGCFSGFMFTDKYTGHYDQDVYFVLLALKISSQKAGI